MCQDYLVGSLDGLETLLLQSRYHISMGELQTAWYIYRRVFHIARLIDLLTQAKVPGSRADSIWFQLVYGEIFLSLILGQPAAITGDIVLVESTNAHTPAQSLERVHMMVARRLASRNVRIENRHRDESRGAAQESYRETRSLDLQLKKAARNMPTAWWKAPTFAAEELDREVMDKTAKLLVQTHQYYLLVVLHQPYILGAPPPNELRYGRDHMNYTYSATATVAASREILTRYLVLRNFHQSSTYRGFDEKAFAAATSLLLVHLNGHSLGATNVPEHQRPHDLGILEDVIHCMETVCSVNRDLRGYSRARTLRELSRMEANAADGCGYVVYSTYAFNEMKGAESVDIRADLEIALPCLGNIYVTRQTTDSFGEDLSATTQMASLAPQFLLKPPNQQDQHTPQNTLGVFGGEISYDESDSSWFDKWSIHGEKFS
ncbi:unnamed protein product [Penicillium olsonii]|nr:unnamed protein product [Penicillium olsonii]